MARTHVRRRRLVAAVLLSVGLWITVPAAANALHGGGVAEHAPTIEYVVGHGDTLWEIATTVVPERDPREVIESIDAWNGLDGAAIVPGQLLLVPAG